MLARTRELTEKDSRLVRGLRVPSRLPGGERVCHRRPELVLSRRAEGPHVHLRADSKERRSAQTVLWQITEALVRLVAPILTFTADEVWEYLPRKVGGPRGQRA
jgi:isoleucyl-tRNA synthetase